MFHSGSAVEKVNGVVFAKLGASLNFIDQIQYISLEVTTQVMKVFSVQSRKITVSPLMLTFGFKTVPHYLAACDK
jgi:hypothetical protein